MADERYINQPDRRTSRYIDQPDRRTSRYINRPERPRQTEPVDWDLPRIHHDASIQVDFPRDAPSMDEAELLEYLMSLQPERLREMSHAPSRAREDVVGPVADYLADAVGNYLKESANAPLPPLYYDRAGRARGSLDYYTPPELRRLLRLPINVGTDVLDFFMPETPEDVALMATGVYGPAAGVALKSVKRAYKSGLPRRGYNMGDTLPGQTERRNARALQSGILTAIGDDVINSEDQE